jgi:hypothetical protein
MCAQYCHAVWERFAQEANTILSKSQFHFCSSPPNTDRLFKKTLPGASASLLQLKVTVGEQRQQALAVIKAARSDPRLSFLALALQGKKVDFGKVLKMIDEMVKTLGAEQNDDNDKKENPRAAGWVAVKLRTANCAS